MAKKVISFLGATSMTETTYCLDESECQTCFMAEAATRFFKPDELLVIVTPEARSKNLPELERRLADYIHPRAVDIPAGRTEAELWIIFNAIASVIEAEDTIVFDVTNAFRSLPILSFLAASYVRVVRQAKVERMVYGAFEAKIDNKTPVFDLTPFIQLLDWTTATDAFLKFGRADDLTLLVREAATSTSAIGSPNTLSHIADTISTLTLALQTSRPTEVMRMTAGLDTQIEHVRATATAAQPFALLLDRISAEYSGFGLATPMQPSLAREVVYRQLDMIQWYRKKGLFVQAMTMAREWLVSLLILETGGDLFGKNQRNQAEKMINGSATTYPELDQANLSRIRSIWAQLRDLRNDLAHTGMRTNPRPAAEVAQSVSSICAALPDLLER